MAGTSGGIGATPTWRGLLGDLLTGRDLSSAETAWAMDAVMAGEVSPVSLAAFLVALRAKGESVAELTGLADAMLGHAVPIVLPREVRARSVDIVGTGGDRFSTVNISTMAALVVAGTGRTVVKHGNRASSSACGSADVLEALGVRLDLPAERVGEVALEAGITFCFANVFHPAMRHAAAARRELGIPTAFNFLGPLTNPARPGVSAVGVADPRMAPLLAGVLATREGRALVFRGQEGLDEISPAGPTDVWRAVGGSVRCAVLTPSDVGMATCSLADLVGADASHNASVARALLDGRTGPVRDAVLLNAAGALAAAEVDEPSPDGYDLVPALRRGLTAAARSVDSGAAAAILEKWVATTRS